MLYQQIINFLMIKKNVYFTRSDSGPLLLDSRIQNFLEALYLDPGQINPDSQPCFRVTK